MASNGGSMLVTVALMCLLVAAPCASAGVTCGQVASSIGACLGYIRGQGQLPRPCCDGVRQLNAMASTTPDRQAACSCLKMLSGRITGLQPPLAAGLPSRCGVNVPYPISTSVDCSKVR